MLKIEGMNNDQCIGIEIVRNAITAPIKQLISNAGFDSSVIIEKQSVVWL